MKIWTKIEWAIIVAASVLLLLLLILFAYNHPRSDDFSYNYFLQQKGYWGALGYLFQHNNGRFFSTLIIFLSPLKNHSIEGYQWLTASLFLFFCVSLFVFLKVITFQFLKTKTLFFLFGFILLSFCSFMPNIQEFGYWLCAEATYLLAASFWLWSIVFHFLLAQKKNEKKVWIWLLCIINTVVLIGTSEAGFLLYSIPLSLHFLYLKQQQRLNNYWFWIVVAVYGITVLAVSFSNGNMNRHELTPFSGNVLLALSGGAYAAAFWISKWALIFVPLVCFYLLVIGPRLNDWAKQMSTFRILKAKTVFISSLLFFLMCQIAVVWMTGSTPEQRFENVLFLFLLFSFLFSAQLMMQEQAEFFDMLKGNLHRGFKTISFVYLICVFLVVPNNAVNAMLDVVSGNAKQFNLENINRYASINSQQGSVSMVAPIYARPKILYFQTLTCSNIQDSSDIPRVALADYFGKKWIYEYPCNVKIQDYSIKEILKQKRQQFFSKGKK